MISPGCTSKLTFPQATTEPQRGQILRLNSGPVSDKQSSQEGPYILFRSRTLSIGSGSIAAVSLLAMELSDCLFDQIGVIAKASFCNTRVLIFPKLILLRINLDKRARH
jgi:hypothetical protein